jgi:hypothetical protein
MIVTTSSFTIQQISIIFKVLFPLSINKGFVLEVLIPSVKFITIGFLNSGYFLDIYSNLL